MSCPYVQVATAILHVKVDNMHPEQNQLVR